MTQQPGKLPTYQFKPLQYLAASGLFPFVAALSVPPFFPTLIYSAFVAVYLYYSKYSTKRKHTTDGAFLLHFAVLFFSVSFCLQFLAGHNSITKESLILISVQFILFLPLLRYCHISMPMLFILGALSFPIIIPQDIAPWAFALSRLMYGGALLGIALTVLREDWKAFAQIKEKGRENKAIKVGLMTLLILPPLLGYYIQAHTSMTNSNSQGI